MCVCVCESCVETTYIFITMLNSSVDISTPSVFPSFYYCYWVNCICIRYNYLIRQKSTIVDYCRASFYLLIWDLFPFIWQLSIDLVKNTLKRTTASHFFENILSHSLKKKYLLLRVFLAFFYMSSKTKRS